MEIKFYKCNVCGNIVCKVEDSGMDMMCCGKQMTELRPESTDGELEKHVPIYEIIDNHIYVQVGSKEHPMEDFHHIEFIGIETDKGFGVKYLMPTHKYPGFDHGKCTDDKNSYTKSPENKCADGKCSEETKDTKDTKGCMLPRACFSLNEGEKLLSVFEYCNLHGMYKNDII